MRTMNPHRRTQLRRLGAAVGALCLLGQFGPASAQSPFPSQPIRLIVPFAPGGGNDILARAIAPGMSKRLGQPVIVENKPGAGGNIGAQATARATDGHTVVIASNQITINPAVGNKMPFDVARDFAPVGLIASVPIVLVVNPQAPYRTLQEFIGYARSHPGKLSYSSPGVGTPQHLAGALFGHLAKVDIVHAPYKGTSPALADVIGNQIEMSFVTLASAAPFLQSSKLRPLAVAGKQRIAAYPDLPTFTEAGLKGYDAELWYCLLAPATMPQPDVQRLNQALVATLNDLKADKTLSRQGFEPATSTPSELKSRLSSDMARWNGLVKATGIHVDL